MKMLCDLKDMLLDSLDEITAKGKLTAGELDAVDKLTHSVKSIDAILGYEQDEKKYSEGRWNGVRDEYDDGRMGKRIDGVSYRGRRRKHDNNPLGINQYSRTSDREHLIQKMEEMLDKATPEEQRIIARCIDELNI